MAFFFRIIQASLRTLARAIGLYFAYYLGLSVVLPLMLAFDAWSVLPLWACMLLAACADFVRALVLVVWFSDGSADGGGAATVGWDGAALPRAERSMVGAMRIKRRSLRAIAGANTGPRHRRQQFGRRQCWTPRRSIGRR